MQGEKPECREQEMSDILGKQASQGQARPAGASLRAVHTSGEPGDCLAEREMRLSTGKASFPAEILVGREVKR